MKLLVYSLLVFTILPPQVVWGKNQCALFLSSYELGRVNWNQHFDKIIELLIQNYGQNQLSDAFVRKLSKQDLQFLIPYINAQVSGDSIIVNAKKRFGSWYKTLEAKGVDVSQIQTDKQPLTETQIISIIQALKQKKIPLNADSVIKSKIENFEILEQRHNYQISGATFYNQAIRKFGSWDKALVAAKQNVKEIKKHKALTVDPLKYNYRGEARGKNLLISQSEMQKVLKKLFVENNLNQNQIRKMSSTQMLAFTSEFGFRISGSAFLYRVIAKCGSVDQALKTIGSTQSSYGVSWTKKK